MRGKINNDDLEMFEKKKKKIIKNGSLNFQRFK